LRKTLRDGKTAQVYELAELIVWKWVYYRKQSMKYP
jgi:hypothetical protein